MFIPSLLLFYITWYSTCTAELFQTLSTTMYAVFIQMGRPGDSELIRIENSITAKD